MTVGERIRKARKDSGLTQNQLAARLAISYVNISQLERGERSPSVDTLQKIADALDVPVGELLGTIPQPDREYERVCDALDDAGLALEATGWGDGSGPDGDRYYIWHKDAESPEGDRTEYSFRELLAVVDTVSRDADARRRDYFRKRLETELFYTPSVAVQERTQAPPPAPGYTDTPQGRKPAEWPPEGRRTAKCPMCGKIVSLSAARAGRVVCPSCKASFAC